MGDGAPDRRVCWLLARLSAGEGAATGGTVGEDPNRVVLEAPRDSSAAVMRAVNVSVAMVGEGAAAHCGSWAVVGCELVRDPVLGYCVGVLRCIHQQPK